MTPEEITAVAQWAHIDPQPLVRRAREIRVTIEAGDPRKTEHVVRECCPEQAWNWPDATTFLASINQRVTQHQLAELVAHRLTRAHMLLRRHEQMLQITNSRPYWQLRPVKDPLTPPDCLAMQHQVMRFDSPFWHSQGPLHCTRVYCRCLISALNERDVQRLGLATG